MLSLSNRRIRTRTYGGVGGAEPRGSPLSRSPRPHGSITNASEYWIARWSLSSGGHSADPLAGDDG
jgi:hypothetical protein